VKIAISGKGGVGKTTLSAMLTGAMSLKGREVIALDADPDANLASALGLPVDEQPAALNEMRDLIAERTGSKGNYEAYFKLNPKVDDIPEKYARKIGNIRLLVLGGVPKGGGGCFCPASALLKTLLVHLMLGREESIVMDMEAGIEHLGRATAQSMDALIIVVDQSPWSIQTAHRVRKLAGDIGMKNVFAVANRLTESADVERIRRDLDGIALLGRVGVDERLAAGVLRLGRDGEVLPADAMNDNMAVVEGILRELQSRI